MKIIIAGPKGTGKTTLAEILGRRLSMPVVETDYIIEEFYERDNGEKKNCREICGTIGESAFRDLEKQAVLEAANRDWCVVSTGGSTLLDGESRRMLRCGSITVLLTADPATIMERIGIGPSNYPSYLKSENKEAEFAARVDRIMDVLVPYADIIINAAEGTPEERCEILVTELERELASRSGAFSTQGTIVRISTFGESHGVALGAVLDGLRPGFEISKEDIQRELDRRRPGQSAMTTSRNEADQVEILSGVFEGKTTGAPLAMLVRNRDQDSSKYDNLRDLFRPGHADFTFWKKYGLRDHRGGGRSSGRETCARVMGGAVAAKILKGKGVNITAYATEVAGIKAEKRNLEEIENNPLRTPDAEAAQKMKEAVETLKAKGDSAGGIVELVVKGCPAGLGDPVFGKLDAKLAQAMFSLGAVKGVEFGEGFASARLSGTENNDTFSDGTPAENRAGGVLGGISTGEDIVLRIAVKPTPSVSVPQKTTTINGENTEVTITGRHDPCIVPRIVPVVESMAALVLLDLMEIQNRLRG